MHKTRDLSPWTFKKKEFLSTEVPYGLSSKTYHQIFSKSVISFGLWPACGQAITFDIAVSSVLYSFTLVSARSQQSVS